MATLVSCLVKDGRLNDLDRISDEKARKLLYQEYHLDESDSLAASRDV